MDCTRLLCPWDFPGKSIRVGCHFQNSLFKWDRAFRRNDFLVFISFYKHWMYVEIFVYLTGTEERNECCILWKKWRKMQCSFRKARVKNKAGIWSLGLKKKKKAMSYFVKIITEMAYTWSYFQIYCLWFSEIGPKITP